MNRELAQQQAERLLATVYKGEESVRLRLVALLEAIGYEIEAEYPVLDGRRMDVYLPRRRVVIETKHTGAAHPDYVRDPETGETQFEQCEHYVKQEWERERSRFDLDNLGDLPWKGILTDGRVWWMWQWDILSDTTLSNALPVVEGDRYSKKLAHLLVEWLSSDTFSRLHGKPWAPRNPAELFEPLRERLKNEIYPVLKDNAGTRTKRDLWLDVLRSSGCAPSGELARRPEDSQYFTTPEGDELFVTHTTLVTISRAVERTLQNDQRAEDGDFLSYVNDGFMAWPFAPGAGGSPTHQEGASWVADVFNVADRYDWRARSNDMLRSLYQNMVPADQRQAFGEFYTPDWLAEMLVTEMLDEEWLEEAVSLAARGDPGSVGILDPACGSGTFLYHAARRIVQYMVDQEYQDGRIADVVARLVNGIDIHPVAVEFSRANVLRALPTQPSNGVNSLNIIQGDSLIYRRTGMALGNWEGARTYTVETPSHRLLQIPVAWTDQESFNDDLHRFVSAANSVPPGSIPIGIGAGLEGDDQKTIKDTYERLIEVCRDEKDSVWGWYFHNIVGPSKLRRQKVNRILANPPWVRMSHVQVPERKSELETLAGELGLWGHGKANTGFDIAGLFVKRTEMNYLAAEGGRAAWVLPQGAINGANWEKVRRDEFIKSVSDKFIDISKVRPSPFSTDSCVWLHRQGEPETEEVERDTPISILINRPNASKTLSTSSWKDVMGSTLLIDAPRRLPRSKAAYLAEDGHPLFRQGATLSPHCLLRIAPSTLSFTDGLASFTTTPSNKRPWSHRGTLDGIDVPGHWIKYAVFPDDIFPFSVRRVSNNVVLPLTGEGKYDQEAEKNPFWFNAESVYQDGRGGGGNTPETLWDQVDYNRKLTRQTIGTHTGGGARKVLYNASGRIGLRAARVTLDAIAEHALYHLSCKSESEAAYLVAILNADCLQEAFRQSKKSVRHFDQHFWHTVPIPRYDWKNKTHRRLALLCKEAEAIAEKVRDSMPDNAGQISVSAKIHKELRLIGLANRINAAAAELLPNQIP